MRAGAAVKRLSFLCCVLAACSAVAPEPSPSPTPEAEHEPVAAQAEGSAIGAEVDRAERRADTAEAPDEVEATGTEAVADSRTVAELAPADRAEPAATEASRLVSAIAALGGLEPDPEPEHTTNDVHYLVSNERRHDLFRPELDDRGGVLLGVGTDQHFVMAGWARPELVVVVDFDPQVIELHQIHHVLMQAAPTVEELRHLWSEAGVEDAHAALRAAVHEPARRDALRGRYDETRELVDGRLRRLAARYHELGVRSYLDAPEQYRFVRELQQQGRVVAIRGDFTRQGALREVARVLDEHELDVEVLYLSNIEQYLAYRKPFRDNMLALPLADDALVLRTLPGKPAGFHYFLQSGDDFLAWMRAARGSTVYRMVGKIKGEPFAANERVVLEALPSDPS